MQFSVKKYNINLLDLQTYIYKFRNKKHMIHKSILLLTLLVFSLNATGTVIIQSDGIGEILDGPGNAVTHSYNYGWAFPLPGAQPIWDSNWSSVPAGTTRVFSETFTLLCKSPVTLYVAAVGHAEVYLNGQFLTSADYQLVVKDIVLRDLTVCGKNTLTFKVTNKKFGRAALAYQLIGDESCTNCPEGSYFNQDKCQCECIQDCECTKPRSVWQGFPTCRCGCPRVQKCEGSQFWNPNTCQCECKAHQMCGPNQIFSQQTCDCQCKFLGLCTAGYVWDNDICECVRTDDCLPKICKLPKVWSQDSCECQCKTKICPDGRKPNPDTCECDYCYPQKCLWPKVWNQDACKCQCKSTVCPKGQSQNPDTCKCECIEKDCRYPLIWSDNQCACVCNDRKCPPGTWLNKDNCECECSPQQCGSNGYWNQDKCECFCKDTSCNKYQKFNYNNCKCECTNRPTCVFGEMWMQEECRCMRMLGPN